MLIQYHIVVLHKLYIYFFKFLVKYFILILQKTAGLNQMKLIKPKKNVSNVLSHN